MQNITLKDFKKGQTAYVVHGEEITGVTVKSVGGKYVTLETTWNPKFAEIRAPYLIETANTSFMGRLLFATKDAAKEYIERSVLEEWFKNIKVDRYSLEQLRMAKIVLESTEKSETVINDTVNTVTELISLLSNVPGDYPVSSVSLNGVCNTTVSVNHEKKIVLFL